MTWELAPCYGLTFNYGPGGEHQMDLVGEGREPTQMHLLKLATRNGLSGAWVKQVVERVAEQAGNYPELARNHAIRKKTEQVITKTIEAIPKRICD